MKLLHTSDWHVGKTIGGKSREDEHIAAFTEMAEMVDEHDVDVVLVAGDLFDTASPSAASEAIVYRALLDFASTGATVAVISGNHDNANRLRAIAPMAELGRVHVVTSPDEANQTGVLRIEVAHDSVLEIGMLPFVSQRGIVKTAELMDNDAAKNAEVYADRLAQLIKQISGSFTKDAVKVLMAHSFVKGGEEGGGERLAHLVNEYAIAKNAFPKSIDYVALGHLHKNQQVGSAPEMHYCGSPLQLDFGEQRQNKFVNLVEIKNGGAATVKPLKLKSGLSLLSISGSLSELRKYADDPKSPDAWLRVTVTESSRAGLAESVREALGDRVVQIAVESSDKPRTKRPKRSGKSPTELFAEYLKEKEVIDPEVEALFNELLTDYWQEAGA